MIRSWSNVFQRAKSTFLFFKRKYLSFNGLLHDHYRGYLISLRESGIRQFEDLRGKRIGFTDENSSSGYKYPHALLLDAGIDPKQDFSAVFMLKKHPYVTDALVRHSIDVGATWSANLLQAQAKYGDIFHIIAESEPIPLDACCAIADLPPSTIAIIRSALISLEADGRELSESRKHGGDNYGFTVRDQAFYNPVRRLLNVPSVP